MSISQLDFPQLSVTLSNAIAAKPWLLVTGGRAPMPAWLQAVATFYPQLWSADHGIDACRAANCQPSHWTGDGDSISADARCWLDELHIPQNLLPTDKDFTDTQIALTEMASAGATGTIITGAFGGRFDHLYSTLFDCSQRTLPCCLIDEQEALFYVKAGMPLTFQCHQKPKALSLIPFTESCHGVTINNVRWTPTPTLRQDEPSATSNELTNADQPVTVYVTAGILGVYFYWGTH